MKNKVKYMTFLPQYNEIHIKLRNVSQEGMSVKQLIKLLKKFDKDYIKL